MAKSQAGFEFIALVGFMFMLFVVMLGLVNTKVVDVQEQRNRQALDDLGSVIAKEIELATKAEPGYMRGFKLPETIREKQYNINLVKGELGSIIVLNFSGFSDIYQVAIRVPHGVYAQNVTYGYNIIRKNESLIVINDADIPTIELIQEQQLSTRKEAAKEREGQKEDVFTKIGRLLGFWKFDEETGMQLVADTSGNNLRGEVHTSISEVEFASGLEGNAVKLDGKDDSIKMQGEELNIAKGDFTIMAWIKTDKKDSVLLAKDASDAGWGLEIKDGKLSYEIYNAASIGSDAYVADNSWHHIAVIHDANKYMFYVDGQLKTNIESDKVAADNSFNLRVGYRNINYDSNKESVNNVFVEKSIAGAYKGLIEDLKIYDKVVEPEEVTAAFEEKKNMIPSIPPIAKITFFVNNIQKQAPYSVYQGQEFRLKGDQSSSGGTGLSITSWGWDLDKTDGISYINNNANYIQHKYDTTGTYITTLKVENSDGLSDTIEETIVVKNPPDPVNNIGTTWFLNAYYPTLQLDSNQNPITFAAPDAFSKELYLIRCSDPECKQSQKKIVIGALELDSFDIVAQDMVLDSQDNPMVAYIERKRVGTSYTFKLHLIRCEDKDCTAKTKNTIDNADMFGYTGLILKVDENGNPILLYNMQKSSTENNLFFVHCNNLDCSDEQQKIEFPQTGTFDMVIDSEGNPIIVIIERRRSPMWYEKSYADIIYCNAPDCTTRSSSTVYENWASISQIKIKLDQEGNPAIIFGVSPGGPTGESLMLLRCSDPKCTNNIEPLKTIATNDQIWHSIIHTSFVMDDLGRPVMTYSYSSEYMANFARCLEQDCNTVYSRKLPITHPNRAPLADIIIGNDRNPVIILDGLSEVYIMRCNDPNCEP